MLKDGDKYINIISTMVCTLKKTDKGLWYIEGKMGKGEPCDENTMSTFLNARYMKVT